MAQPGDERIRDARLAVERSKDVRSRLAQGIDGFDHDAHCVVDPRVRALHRRAHSVGLARQAARHNLAVLQSKMN
jgi:hypothetical protein